MPRDTQALTQPPATNRRTAVLKAEGEAPQTRSRLHIAPLNPELLQRYVPSTVLPLATGISYHSVQTFPEKQFGYVELPTAEAQKLKTKYNGSILKGMKVSISDAKPEKRKRKAEDDGDAGVSKEERKAAKKAKKEKKEKRKREDGVLNGIELPAERTVKRGWTEPAAESRKKDKKDRKQEPSQHKIEEAELLFKTKLPPNKKPTKEERKKSKEKKDKKDKNPKNDRNQVVVHEFEKNKAAAPAPKNSEATSSKAPTSGYVEGKGWVDADGDVVEAETRRSKRKKHAVAEASVAGKAEKTPVGKVQQLAQHDSEAKNVRTSVVNGAGESEDDDDEDESSEVSEEDDEEDDEADAQDDALGQQMLPNARPAGQMDIDSPATAVPSITVQPGSEPNSAEPGKVVHPLEALFKRPKLPTEKGKQKLAPIDTTFSFFGGGDAEAADGAAGIPIPQTPFTQQDREERTQRSAAPTPDTAAIGLRFRAPWRDNDEDDKEVEEENADGNEDDEEEQSAQLSQPTPSKTTQIDSAVDLGVAPAGKEAEESAFAKWFWEHRGETNRAWKERRRQAKKAVRYRENKAKSSRRV